MPNPWEPDFPTEEQPYFEYQERERPWAEAQQQWDLLQPDPWEYGQGRGGDPWDILGHQANWGEDSPAEWLGAEQGGWAEGLFDREMAYRNMLDAYGPEWEREEAMDRNFVRNALEETRERALPWIDPMFQERFMNQPLALWDYALPGADAGYHVPPGYREPGRPTSRTGTIGFAPGRMPDPETLVHEFAHSMDLARGRPRYSDVALDAYPNDWGKGTSLGQEPYATGATMPREIPAAVRPLYPWLNMGYYAPKLPAERRRVPWDYIPPWWPGGFRRRGPR